MYCTKSSAAMDLVGSRPFTDAHKYKFGPFNKARDFTGLKAQLEVLSFVNN